MATIAVGTDKIRTPSQDNADLQKFCEALRNAGHTVTNVGRGPNSVQGHMLQSKNACDIMIQIAGGLCIGTLGDFISMIKRGGYHAKKGAIVYNMVANDLNAKTWIAEKAWDWYYSMSVVTPYVGKTLPQVYSENSDVLVGFADGENIDEVIKNFLAVLGGKSSGEGEGIGGGSSILELIKQVCSDWDYQGVELQLNGDTLSVRRTNPKTAKPLTTSSIVNNSVSVSDYDSNTPNKNGSVVDKYLADRFGEIIVDEGLEDSDKEQILQIAQRGHNHSIDLKTILNADYNTGNWVSLTLKELGMENRKYYVSKASYQEDRMQTLTLEPAPPSIYVEATEVAEDDATTDEDLEDVEDV